MIVTQALHFAITAISPNGLPNHTAAGADPGASATQVILNIVFGISASIALLIIVISGFRYIVAHGDPNAVAQARNSILYAVIGLIVSLAGFSIVTFIIKAIG